MTNGNRETLFIVYFSSNFIIIINWINLILCLLSISSSLFFFVLFCLEMFGSDLHNAEKLSDRLRASILQKSSSFPEFICPMQRHF